MVVDLDEKKEKALNIALNKISGEWDNDLLANLLKDLDGSGYDITLTGFDLAEAQELFGSGSMENVHEDDFDADSAVSEISEPKTKRGDLWILGAHRLLCGDCIQKEDVAKVLEDKYADVMVTDPPYNVDYGGTINGKDRNIANDNLSEDEFYQFLLSFYKAAEIFQNSMYNMISIIVSVCASIISGMVLFFLQRFFKKKQKKDEERDRAKAKENMLILKSIDAVGKLTYADAVAIRDGKTNGEMKEAMKVYAEVKDELYEYLLEQNSKK